MHLEGTQPAVLEPVCEAFQALVERLALPPPRRPLVLPNDVLGAMGARVAVGNNVLQFAERQVEREASVALLPARDAVERKLEHERLGAAAVANEQKSVSLGGEMERDDRPRRRQERREGRVGHRRFGGLDPVPLTDRRPVLRRHLRTAGAVLVFGRDGCWLECGPFQVVVRCGGALGELEVDRVEHLATESDGEAEVCESPS